MILLLLEGLPFPREIIRRLHLVANHGWLGHSACYTALLFCSSADSSKPHGSKGPQFGTLEDGGWRKCLPFAPIYLAYRSHLRLNCVTSDTVLMPMFRGTTLYMFRDSVVSGLFSSQDGPSLLFSAQGMVGEGKNPQSSESTSARSEATSDMSNSSDSS